MAMVGTAGAEETEEEKGRMRTPQMIAVGAALVADQSVNGMAEVRYGREVARRLWWASTGVVGIPAMIDPAMERDGGWLVEGRSGVMLRGCSGNVCAGASVGVGVQHRRVAVEEDPRILGSGFTNAQTSVLGDGRLHAMAAWADEGRAGLEVSFGFRYQHIVLEENSPMVNVPDRAPRVMGVVLAAAIVGSL